MSLNFPLAAVGICTSSMLYTHFITSLSTVQALDNLAVSLFGADALQLAAGQAQICFECLGDDMSKPRLRTAAQT